MSTDKEKIVFIGSGAIATAIGDVLAATGRYEVVLLSIEESVVKSVNSEHFNYDYFPYCRLDEKLRASLDKDELRSADFIFIAIPSTAVYGYVSANKDFFNEKAVVVNLSKGFGQGGQIIPDCLAPLMHNTLVSLKGPSFAREIIKRQVTGLTAASSDVEAREKVYTLFNGTNISTDFSDDITGVELSSILKNIYAIAVGIVDANFESANLRSMFISRCINEIRRLMLIFGGKESTVFNYCGFGDFTLTALHDMSRNRTLGLLIGKGFFTAGISEKVVLEGRMAVDVFYEKIKDRGLNIKEFLIINELYHIVNDSDYKIKKFLKNVL